MLEPLALRDLADAKRQGTATDDTLEVVLDLLLKPPRGEQAVLIKPSNLVNNLINQLLDACPEARALLMTSSLESFLLSCLKKPADTRGKMPWLLSMVAEGSDFLVRIGQPDPKQLDYLQVCALVWLAHRNQLSAQCHTRLRWLRMEEFLADQRVSIEGAARFLHLAQPEPEHLQACLSRNAKEPGLRYGPEQRRAEAARVRKRYGSAIIATIGWLDDEIRPRVTVKMPPLLGATAEV
ncbi:MAG: hypothetical protein R3200_12585 [Xanthomonadales bacterium]|nr:hypothetical protein [Xanthomonadales bacterium]